eukprot:6474736-Amphidinium_carterae.1
MAKWSSPLIAGKASSSGSDALDRTLWDDVLEEFKKGWLTDPYDLLAQLRSAIDEPVVVSRRFPLAQNEKVRAIDELSESQVNAAYAMNSKVDLMNIDVMGALCRLIFRLEVQSRRGQTVLPEAVNWK